MNKSPIYTAAICTLGCRVNQYESQAIAEELLSHGIEMRTWDEICDLYIINTCAVTAQSSRKSRQMIRHAHKQNPNALILVTGCEAQLSKDALLQLPSVAYVCGNANKRSVVDTAIRLLQEHSAPLCNIVPLHGYEPMQITKSERTRAYVKIQDGCNGKCAYCIIPRLRGEVRSRPLEDTLSEIKTLCENGYREVVLTGIETAAYQHDLGYLMACVNDIVGIERIRLGSMDPGAMTPAFIDRIASLSHVMPHFHLSLQSGCDQTLARMRRKYNTSQIENAVTHFRAVMPNVQFTADIIVGFPGETDEEFEKTYSFLKKLKLSGLHIFPYSPRPQTEAATMPNQIPKEIKSTRLSRLEALKEEMWHEIASAYIGKTVSVLFEQWENGFATGHTENFLEAELESNIPLDNQILSVTVQRLKNGRLCGVLKKEQ